MERELNNAINNLQLFKDIISSNRHNHYSEHLPNFSKLWYEYYHLKLKNLNESFVKFMNIYDNYEDISDIKHQELLTLYVLYTNIYLNI